MADCYQRAFGSANNLIFKNTSICASEPFASDYRAESFCRLLFKRKAVLTVMKPKEKAHETNVGDKQVKEIVEPTISVPRQAKVNAAIDDMAAQKADSAPVIDEESKLLGTVSKDRLNRKVGGRGHDPESFPVESEINKQHAFCFSDQKIDDAEELMQNEKVGEVPVVNRDQVLIGKANLEKIKKEKQKSQRRKAE
jgi:CBS domain-containing protein